MFWKHLLTFFIKSSHVATFILKAVKTDFRYRFSLTRSSLLSGVTAVKVAEADIVVVTVQPQRMSRDDAFILSG